MTRTRREPSPSAGQVSERDTARSVTDQTVAELGGNASLLVRQRKDHALLERLVDEVRAADGARQDELLTRLARLVSPHSCGEKTVLWPVLRAVLPDGEELTLRNEAEHQRINEVWTRLEQAPCGGSRRHDLIGALTDLLHQDARDEEDLLLPQLQQALTVRQLRRLGRTWELVRRTAPTRPHPVGSRRPPGNTVAGLPLALLDRSCDRLDRAARTAPALAAPLTAVSRALAASAGLVERLPLSLHGERAATRAGRTGGPS